MREGEKEGTREMEKERKESMGRRKSEREGVGEGRRRGGKRDRESKRCCPHLEAVGHVGLSLLCVHLLVIQSLLQLKVPLTLGDLNVIGVARLHSLLLCHGLLQGHINRTRSYQRDKVTTLPTLLQGHI